MAPAQQRILRAVILAALAVLLGGGTAAAASARPNALDRRIDAISNATLMAEPATRLADAERQIAADRLVNWKLPGWLATVLFDALALAYFWQSGAAAALRDRLRRRLRSETTVRFAFGAALGLLARLAAFPATFYLYRIERVMGLSLQLTRVWGLYWIFHTLLAMLIAGTVAAFVLWLVDRTHQWYLYTIAAIVVASVLWAYSAAYFAIAPGQMQAMNGVLAAQLDPLLAREGFPGVPIYVESGGSSASSRAVVQGAGPMRRVLLPATFVAGSTPAEVVYAVAFELGRIANDDPLWIALIEAAILIVGAALAVTIADRIGFRRDDDALSRLALVAALLAIVYAAGVPPRNLAVRGFDLRDDRYAVALTGDRAAAVRAILRATDQRLDEVCPDVMARTFIDTLPAPGARIAALNGIRNGCP